MRGGVPRSRPRTRHRLRHRATHAAGVLANAQPAERLDERPAVSPAGKTEPDVPLPRTPTPAADEAASVQMAVENGGTPGADAAATVAAGVAPRAESEATAPPEPRPSVLPSLQDRRLSRVMRGSQPETESDCVPTNHPNIFCTPLPLHWRSNRALPRPFTVMIESAFVPDGTTVTVKATNDDHRQAEVRNSAAVLIFGKAVFDDLRFISRSTSRGGRGRHFDVTITVCSNPPMVGTLSNAIKITADGPREPRQRNVIRRPSNTSSDEESPMADGAPDSVGENSASVAAGCNGVQASADSSRAQLDGSPADPAYASARTGAHAVVTTAAATGNDAMQGPPLFSYPNSSLAAASASMMVGPPTAPVPFYMPGAQYMMANMPAQGQAYPAAHLDPAAMQTHPSADQYSLVERLQGMQRSLDEMWSHSAYMTHQVSLYTANLAAVRFSTEQPAAHPPKENSSIHTVLAETSYGAGRCGSLRCSRARARARARARPLPPAR